MAYMLNAEKYRAEAARCEREASRMVLPEARRRLEDIARTYVKMAAQVERLSAAEAEADRSA